MSNRMLRRNPLEEWIKFATNDPDILTQYGPCVMISLVRSEKGFDDEVHSTPLTAQWKAEELAEKLYNIARQHCKDIPGGIEHRYRLLAFYRDGQGSPKADKAFAINPYGQESEYVTETPDDKGARAQGMRLLETMAQGTFTILRQTIGDTAAELKDARRENREMFGMMKEMMMAMAEMKFDHQMKLRQFDRETTERNTLIKFAPALVNQILGKDIFPQGMADTALIDTIAENITEEQIQKLASSADGLPPQVWGPLAMRVHKAMADKRKLQEGVKSSLKLIQGAKNPEDDAAGD